MQKPKASILWTEVCLLLICIIWSFFTKPTNCQKKEHHFLELTFVILLITQKCDSLSRNSMDFEMLWYPLPRMKQLSRHAHRGILVSWTPNAIKYTSPTRWLSLVESPFTTEWFKGFWSSNVMRTPTSSKGHWVRTWAAAEACRTSRKSTEVPNKSWHEGVFDDH